MNKINDSGRTKLKAVLFDLDGTLLPMDQDRFVNGYFGYLTKKMEPYGYDAGELVKAIWHGTKAMVTNDGKCTNEKAFWNDFAGIYGEKGLKDACLFEEFYAGEFDRAKELCGFNRAASETVHSIKSMGYRVALATNPVFPEIATRLRIRWAGLEPEEFEMFTTYENIGYSKPNPDYYREVLKRMQLKPEECLMVGNDADEDMVAEKLGMKVFLLTDCLINRSNRDINNWPHGSFDELMHEIYTERRK